MAISSVGRFCQWLEQTPPSQFIQGESWLVPAVQTVHILAISAVAGSALLINLRLLGALCTDQSVESISKRFAPVIWWALPILLVTGTVLTIGEPARELLNPVFRLKMVLILTAMALLAYFQKSVSRNPGRYEGAQRAKGAAIAVAIPSLLVWAGIIVAGRWIAYI
jgi:uncharacterized membrane protein